MNEPITQKHALELLHLAKHLADDPYLLTPDQWASEASQAIALGGALAEAAPELLETCQYVDSIAPEGEFWDEELIEVVITGKALKDLRTAIAKAQAKNI